MAGRERAEAMRALLGAAAAPRSRIDFGPATPPATGCFSTRGRRALAREIRRDDGAPPSAASAGERRLREKKRWRRAARSGAPSWR